MSREYFSRLDFISHLNVQQKMKSLEAAGLLEVKVDLAAQESTKT